MSATPSAIDARSHQRPVLLRERHQRAVGADAGGTARVREQHEREQSRDLTVVGQQLPHGAGESDGFAGELRALEFGPGGRRVALVEDQVQHVQHDTQPLGAFGLGRQGERDITGLDRLLGPADALRHRRLRHQEGGGDLCGRETADRSQGERELRRRRQRGMAAQEEERQRVVAVGEQFRIRRRRDERVGRNARRGPVLAATPRVRAPELVGEAARRHRDQPRAWLLRHPLLRPLPRGREQRFLGRILTGVELAVAAHERSEDLRCQLPQQILDARVGAHISSPPAFMSGRTSIAVYRASGICDARSLARSTESQSTT